MTTKLTFSAFLSDIGQDFCQAKVVFVNEKLELPREVRLFWWLLIGHKRYTFKYKV